eukprot:15012021-Alexandrium_andersonii.AAC.1
MLRTGLLGFALGRSDLPTRHDRHGHRPLLRCCPSGACSGKLSELPSRLWATNSSAVSRSLTWGWA